MASTALTTYAGRHSAAEGLRPPKLVLHYVQDREIYREGDDSGVFFTVMSGMVRTCKSGNDGRRQIDAFHGPGDVFGFEPGLQQSLSAEAVCDCTVGSNRWRGLAALDGVPHHLFSHAMRSLARAQEHSLLLGRNAVEKVAAFLLAQAGQSGDGAIVSLQMTRQDIADYLGLTVETVSRTLSRLERASLISLITARQIRLLDAAGLHDVHS